MRGESFIELKVSEESANQSYRQVAMALAGGWAAAATEKGRAVVTVPMGGQRRAADDQARTQASHSI